ncbi:Asp-tRNA(Asn)/Glu-tRNA(Gln) amidotransferase subunit GatC [Thermaurantiacus sp.]
MAVDEPTVARVARLARLRLGEGEAARLASELNRILGWIDQLQKVETEGVAPLDQVIPFTRQWREDAVTDGNIQDDILANAPAASHGFFAVPKVIE